VQIQLAVEGLVTIAENIAEWEYPARLGALGGFGEIERALREQAVQTNRRNVIKALGTYRWSIEALCDLSAGQVLPPWQHREKMLAAVSDLRSESCFGNQVRRAT
jgi:hypothetical protein